MAFSDFFNSPIENCNEVNNGSSALYVQKVVCPNDEPSRIVFTADAAAAVGAQTINVTSDSAETQYIRSGSVLTFTTNATVIVTVDTVVEPGVSTQLLIEPLVGIPLAAGDVYTSWCLQRILSPINIPTNITAQEEDRTDLSSGIQGSMVKTKIESNLSITVFNNIADRALYEVIFPAAQSDASIYVLVVRSSGVHTFGRALVSNWNDDGANTSLSKPQFEIKMQAPFANTPPAQWIESVSLRAQLNSMRRLSGLRAIL